ncbi:MAG TPA: hypothetical protein VGE62_00160 [Candidatus Paceibacterota bacterium]
MGQFLLNPFTAAIGILISAFVYWLAMHSSFSYVVADFFNLLAPCVQYTYNSIPCQANWNLHVGMAALVVGVIWTFILIRWAVKTFGRIFVGGLVAILALAIIVAVLAYLNGPGHMQ